jgi:fatty acid desaturase
MPDFSPPKSIAWYRSPLSPEDFKALHARSDWKGWLQTVGFLAVLALTGAGVFFASAHLSWPFVVLALLLNGMAFSFCPNAMHELGHGTVFKTKFLNEFFTRVTGFLNWNNYAYFAESHSRHHRYTLHPPDDLEVVLPTKVAIRQALTQGIVNWPRFKWTILFTIRIARGKFEGEWENRMFPASDPEKQRRPMRAAQGFLAGHALIIAASIYFKLWLLPVVVTFAAFYGDWLFFLCNNAQHTGMTDNVRDFRLCCRTILLDPFTEFMYWHMNFHTEHHMYAAVPCYNLGRLHRLIEHDMPHCPRGVIESWREITEIQRRQKEDPGYKHIAALPPTANPSPAVIAAT